MPGARPHIGLFLRKLSFTFSLSVFPAIPLGHPAGGVK
nr:MAG TPA: hypothetical protein [Microviridae sp.]